LELGVARRPVDDYLGRAGCVELIEADCAVAGEETYGIVLDGYITVKGELGPANLGHFEPSDFDTSPEDVDEELRVLKLCFSDWNHGALYC